MKSNTKNTETANFDKFAQAPEIVKACKLNEFSKLSKAESEAELSALNRALKIGAIISQARAYLESEAGKIAKKQHGLTNNTDILIYLYGYSRSVTFEYMKAHDNREKLPAFVDFLQTTEGKSLTSKGYKEFNRFCAGNEGKAKAKPQTDVIKLEANGKKGTFNPKTGEAKSDLNAADILPLVTTAVKELQRLGAKTELESLHKLLSEAVKANKEKTKLGTKRSEAKANEAAKKAAAKVAAQPMATA